MLYKISSVVLLYNCLKKLPCSFDSVTFKKYGASDFSIKEGIVFFCKNS